MNFLKRKTTWSYLELGIIKVCLLSEGILAGIYLTGFFSAHQTVLWIIFSLGLSLSLVLWLGKLKNDKGHQRS
jgi:hypothetical protein